jgi:simple sugar transport system substrate-binding protein
MARIIDQAAASKPQGIITTLADFDVLSGPISNAVAKGIPVIIINSGTPEQAAEVGALMYIGQPAIPSSASGAVVSPKGWALSSAVR